MSQEENKEENDGWTEGLPVSKRRILQLGAMGALGGVGAASALSPDSGGQGDIFGGTMALTEAFKVAEGERDWYQGPDSAKSNINGNDGDRYSATDFNVEYYWDSGWQILSVGSDSKAVPSVTTDVLSNEFEFIFGGTSVSDINSKLSSSGRYILVGDHTGLSDRIEIGASDVTLVVGHSATLKMSDGATPTTVTIANEKTPVIYNDGHDHVDICVLGEIDANDTNHTRGTPVVIDGRSTGEVVGGSLEMRGTTTDANDAAWVDTTRGFNIPYIEANSGVASAVLALYFDTDSQIGALYGDNVGEVIDMGNTCDGTYIGLAYGRQTTEEVVDLDVGQDVTIEHIHSDGCKMAAEIGTSDAGLSASNDITIKGVTGDTTGDGIVIRAAAHPVQNLSITGINLESNEAEVIRIDQETANAVDGLMLKGYVRRTGSTNGEAVTNNVNNTASSSGILLDLIGEHSNNDVFEFANISDVTGRLVAKNYGSTGITIKGSVSKFNLILTANNGFNGLRVQGSNGSFVGHARGNSSTDLELDSATEVAAFGNFDSRTRGTRTPINLVGTNAGDPNSTGDWNGEADFALDWGVTVWNESTDPDDGYMASPDGNWAKTAS